MVLDAGQHQEVEVVPEADYLEEELHPAVQKARRMTAAAHAMVLTTLDALTGDDDEAFDDELGLRPLYHDEEGEDDTR